MSMSLYNITFYDIICRNARLYPDRPAWLEADKEQPMTFAQYRAEVDRMAAGLATAGAKRGERIGVIAKNCIPYVVLYGAAAALGCIVTGINWRLSADEMAYNLRDVGVGSVFVDQDNPETVAAVREKIDPSVPFYNLGGNGAYAPLPEGESACSDFSCEAIHFNDGWVIIHTAAVSGHPRGALLSQANITIANIQLMHQLSLTAADVHLGPLPLFHIAGLGLAMCCFHAAIPTILMAKFDAARAARLINRHKASIMFAFSPMTQMLLSHVEQTGEDISALRAIVGIDAPDVISRYQELTGGAFYSMFGQTETSLMATMCRYDERPGSAGRPIPLVEIQLMDDNDQPVPTGQPGEIAIRGPMVFKGYWGLESENAHTFRNGWHHTGDMGRFDEDGYLWYVSRKAEKELIKPGGENVYPAEVENAILDHPAVAEVVVFGVPDPKWGEGIKAVCRLKSGQTLTVEALIDFVGDRIARYKKPQYVEFVDEIPKTGDVIDRVAVKKQYGGHR